MLKSAPIVVTALTLARTAIAHPGHGVTEGSSLLHFIAEPAHVLAPVAVLLFAGTAVAWARRRGQRTPGR